MTRTIFIHTRPSNGGYTARAQGLGITASSTMDPRFAAERVAIKVKTGKKQVEGLEAKDFGILVISVTTGLFGANSYRAEWQETEAK
jgi:hypothetical protein